MNKRILSIWDFRVVPYSIGDLIIFLERIQIELKNQNIDKIDFCFVYDPNLPAREFNTVDKGKDDQTITTKNFHYHFLPLISTIYISKYIGKFFIFDNHDELYEFIENNKDKYIVMPDIDKIKNKEFYYRDNFSYIQNYYEDNKSIPCLECKDGTIETINQFYYDNFIFKNKYPVVCHIRKTKSMAERNSNYEAWKDFFDYCLAKYSDVKFVLIGTKNDTKQFKGLLNIVISKDYFSTVEEDMILLKQSLCFLGTRSGTCTMAFFSDIPYAIFNFIPAPHEKYQSENRFNFMKNNQYIYGVGESFDIIKNGFEKIYYNVNKLEWEEKIINNKFDNKSNLELI